MLPYKATLMILMLITSLMLASCGSSDSAARNPEQTGKELFEQATLGSAAGCRTCHSLEPGAIIIGPSLSDIGAQAGSRVAGVSAEEYLKQSILDPNAYVTENFPKSVMPNVYGTQLTEEQVDQLVAFLLTLDGVDE